MIKSYITSSRNAYAFEMKGRVSYWSLSPITYALYGDIVKSIDELFLGNVLDAGAGGLNAKMFFEGKSESYTSFDVQNRTGEIDIVGDIQNMVSIDSNCFDTVYCSQVLEHVPEPANAISEISRVLKKSGTCIISVPHISHYHEVPHDYYRFTEYGLKYLLEKNNFEVIEIKKQSGLIGLLLHPISVGIISLSWRIPLFKWLAFFFNKYMLVIPAFYLDKILPLSKIYPVNILLIARKKN